MKDYTTMELRAYFFGNMYLSSIQQGIQAAHVVTEMFNKYYVKPHPLTHMLNTWARNDKTMILLNAGPGIELHRLHRVFSSSENPFPHATFYEDGDALDGAMTSVGIILPEYIWVGAQQIKANPIERPGIMLRQGFVEYQNSDGEKVEHPFTRWEFDELICQLGNYGLAK